jgi:hypothetical protein
MQATISTIDFDYLGYAATRLGEYRRLRASSSAAKNKVIEKTAAAAASAAGAGACGAVEGSLVEE